MIRSRAAAKSAPSRTSRSSRTATMAASLTRLARSAPEKPGVPLATTSRFTLGPSCLPRQWTFRMARRSDRVGSGMVTCRSKRPGRSSAGSSTSGLLVAPRTTIPVAGSNPSISESNWLRVCSRSSLASGGPAPARRWPMASISSTKTITGARLRASSNRSRTRAAPTPTNIPTKLDPVTEKNGTFASPATARASRVLPVPGGPTIRTPRGGIAPARAYRSGCCRKSTTSRTSSFAPSYPATSANVVFVDEIDAIGQRRAGAGAMVANDEREQTLNQLLSEMDGFDPATGIVVLGATNRPEVLDPALLRPGRFDRQVIIPLPTLSERLAILNVHCRGKQLGPSVNLDVVARGTPGFSGADLANLVNEAAIVAVRDDRDVLEGADFAAARDRIILGRRRGRGRPRGRPRRSSPRGAG